MTAICTRAISFTVSTSCRRSEPAASTASALRIAPSAAGWSAPIAAKVLGTLPAVCLTRAKSGGQVRRVTATIRREMASLGKIVIAVMCQSSYSKEMSLPV